jgi:hypothetical protein
MRNKALEFIDWHGNAASGRQKPVSRQMQKHGAATPCNTRSCVVIDFDNEIIKMIFTPQSIA